MNKIICGNVNSDGSIESGSGFSSKRMKKGRYIVTFDSKFKNRPAVVAIQNFLAWDNFEYDGGDAFDNAVLIAVDDSHFKLLTGNTSAHGEPDDRNFSFIAIGSSK